MCDKAELKPSRGYDDGWWKSRKNNKLKLKYIWFPIKFSLK